MAIRDAKARAVSRLRRLRNRLDREIAIIVRPLNEEGGRLSTDPENLRTALAVRTDILAALENLGAGDVQSETAIAAAEAAKEVVKTIPVESFSPSMAATIERIVLTQLDGFPKIWDEAADNIRLIVDRAIVTGLGFPELLDRVAAQMNLTFSQAETLAEAAIMAAHRQTVLEIGKEMSGILYLYTGPKDGKIRPFCDQHRGKAFSKEALDALDNGQGLKPTSAFLGGYNCRHFLAPIDRGQAIEDPSIEVVE